jgi:hypothetical protein
VGAIGMSNKEKTKNVNWAEILVGGIILLLLSLLLGLVFDMKGTLGFLQSKTNENSRRSDGIVSILSDIGIRIASEEIRKPFEVSPGKWASAVHVMDMQNLLRTTFEIPLDSPEDMVTSTLVNGIAWEHGADSVSFERLADWSSEIGKPETLPIYLDRNASFVLHKVPSDFVEQFRILGVSPKTYPLTIQLDSWNKLLREIEKNAQVYKIK